MSSYVAQVVLSGNSAGFVHDMQIVHKFNELESLSKIRKGQLLAHLLTEFPP